MKANLHVNKKTTLVLVAIIVGILTLLTIVISVSITADISHLDALIRSDYEYSAVVNSTTAPDRYILFNAGIWFALASDAETSLNVDVVMQSEIAEYTAAVCWNAEKLGERDVAISKNIADKYHLSVGDIVYSKHVVDGIVYGYVVESIIPSVIGTRITEDGSYSTGLIIMGHDQRYVDNVTNSSLVFTKEPISSLEEMCDGTPEQLIYRGDELLVIGMRILPYIVVYIALAVCGMIGMVCFLSRAVEHNFRRLAMIGYGQQALNAAYNLLLWGTSGTVIAIGFVIALLAFSCCINEINCICLAIPAVATASELFTTYVSSAMARRRLWRK